MTAGAVAAIVPAAGTSRRMGRPKLLLPWGGRTVICQVVDALRRGGADPAIVVTTAELPELAEQARAAGADVLVLPEPTSDMQATVIAGLRRLLQWGRRWDGWLLCPADQPTLTPGLVRQLLDAFARQRQSGEPAEPIIIPVHNGRRGHPVVFSWSHAAAIIRKPCPGGIRDYIHAHAAAVIEWPCGEPAVLDDMDTPQDYERLQRRGGL